MAAVRPEFRADELAFDPRDPCSAGSRAWSPPAAGPPAAGLCHGHRQRWAARPADVAGFAAAADPRWRKNAPLTSCRAPGCGYGVSPPQGPVRTPRRRVGRAGTPTCRAGWTRCRTTARSPAGGLPDRQLRAVGRARKRLVPVAGSDLGTARTPGAAEFAARWGRHGIPAASGSALDGLPAQLKLEMQYALQRRHDEREGKAPPYVVMIMVRFLAASGASSLLERTEQEWRDAFGEARQRGRAAGLVPPRRSPTCAARRRLGRRVSPRRLADAPPRLRGPDLLDFSRIPQPAERPGQALDPVAAEHRPEPGSGRPAAARPDPARRLPPRPRRHRRRRHQPGRARGLPRRPPAPWAAGRSTAPTSAPRAVPHRGPPARLGTGPAGGRDAVPRRPAAPHRAAAPGPGRARDGPGRAARQPRPRRRTRPTGWSRSS